MRRDQFFSEGLRKNGAWISSKFESFDTGFIAKSEGNMSHRPLLPTEFVSSYRRIN